jgi:hypothetical protein
VGKFRSFITSAASVFAVLHLAPMSIAAPKAVIPPAPPQPVEQKVTVKRGGSVDIPLKIYGTRSQTLAWIIRKPPVAGKLSSIRATGAEAAVVTYRPPADLGVVSERFTFSVRSSEGVSAPVEVSIAITDDPPQINSPGELDFGVLLVGASATKALEFSNSGGGIAEGTIEVSAPWKIEGARRYKLAAAEMLVTKIVFAPERAGKFEGEVKFTSQPDRAVIVRGIAEEPLAVAPAELTLRQDAGRPLRAASFELRNNTGAALDVAVTASPRVIVRTPLRVPPHGLVTVPVQVAESDTAALDETVVFTAGEIAARLALKAKALPALVRAQPESVIFRRGAGSTEKVVFQNVGGMEAKVTLAIGAPFAVSEAGFSLAPGAAKEVALSLAAPVSGGSQAMLKVGAEGGGFEVPVEVAGSTGPDIVIAPRRPPAPAPARVRRDGEPSGTVVAPSGPYSATVESVSANAASFRWSGAPAEGAQFRCLQRILTVDENGELATTFQDYSASKIAQHGSENVATVEKLEPGKSYLFRIDSVLADAATPVTFAQIRTPSPRVRKSPISLVGALVILAIAAGGISIWQRSRSRSGF